MVTRVSEKAVASTYLEVKIFVRIKQQGLPNSLNNHIINKTNNTYKRGPLSLVNATEELLERKSSGSGLESPEYGRRDPSR
jgi:hypothetical protein